jgi:H/ACA ribonucleoprotein complex subunit 4
VNRNLPDSIKPSFLEITMQRNASSWETKRILRIKAEEESNPRYGINPQERALTDYIKFGIINLDKPSGPSSQEVTAWVKRVLDLKKAGHGGTLEASQPGKSQSDRDSTYCSGRCY